MRTNPKISIITITFNSEKTLEETIKSVISQDYDNLEYIIVDGKSTDKTLEIVDKYKAKISKVVSERDKGISDGFNKGINLATGEIIGIINSDDLLLSDALKAIAENYDPDIDVYRGKTITWNDKTNYCFTGEPTMRFPLYKGVRSVSHQATFVTKNAYNKRGGFRLDLKYAMDVDLLKRFYIKGATFKYVPKELAVFRWGGATNDGWTRKAGEWRKIIIGNGGTELGALFATLRNSCRQIAKSIAFKVFTMDGTRKKLLNRHNINLSDFIKTEQ